MAEFDKAGCALHEDRNAAATCARCGDFACAECLVTVLDRQVCASCQRSHGNYLEAYRAQLVGKRDSFVWLFSGFGLFVAALHCLVAPILGGWTLQTAGALLAYGIYTWVAVAYLLLKPWARAGLIVSAVFGLAMGFLVINRVTMLAGVSFWGLLFSIAAYFDTRNRIAFGLEVSEKKLARAYSRFVDNSAARNGLNFSVLGLLVPPFALIGLPMSVVGLRRVDPDSWPPIGKRGAAIAGIICSTIGLLWGAGFALYLVMQQAN